MTLFSYGVLLTPSATRHRMINRALAETTHMSRSKVIQLRIPLWREPIMTVPDPTEYRRLNS